MDGGRREGANLNSISYQIVPEMPRIELTETVGNRYGRRQAGRSDLLYASTLFTTQAVVQPAISAIIQYLISLAIDKEGDISTVCLMLSGWTATTCLTATSEMSI